jgi:hypothetical protein
MKVSASLTGGLIFPDRTAWCTAEPLVLDEEECRNAILLALAGRFVQKRDFTHRLQE